ncbi:MAG TPA: hypothetical protein VIC85_08065 [Ktedonobacterales bacterium]|jgi:hypothetical protein
MVLANITRINFIPSSGILDTIFHQTWVRIAIFGLPRGGYFLTLIGLILLLIIALAAAAVIERLTGAKPGKLWVTFLITLLGAFVFTAYVSLPFEIILEGVSLIAAFVGAVVIGTFYVLIRNAVKGGK